MRKIAILSVVVVLVFCAASASAQADRLEPMRISVMKADVRRYLNEVVRIDGFVTQFVDSGSQTTSFFYIKDDWGSVIKVRTSNQPPSVGKRYSIVGPVSIDPKTKDLYISEEKRQELFKGVEPWVAMQQVEAASPPVDRPVPQTSAKEPAVAEMTGTQTAQPAGPAQSKLPMYLLIGGAAAAILIIALFLILRSRSDESQTMDLSVATAAAAAVEAPPPPEQVIEGRTIKMHTPPPNTVKLFPGWFEVLSGDDVVKQIRFYKLGGEHGAETTFGRASGRPYAHIQLKAQTVSSRQAKVTFDNGAARLTNFATSDSNPTRVNGRDLDINESVPLKDSDRVEMGEVSLLFHEAQSSANVVRA
jgi:hypothetical protein